MSNAPYVLPGARFGLPLRRRDAARPDELRRSVGLLLRRSDGARRRAVAAELGITREVQDEFAYQSHQRAHAGARGRQARGRDRAAQRRDQGEGQDRRRRGAAYKRAPACRRTPARTARRLGLGPRPDRRTWTPTRAVLAVRHRRRSVHARRPRRAGARATPRSRRWPSCRRSTATARSPRATRPASTTARPRSCCASEEYARAQRRRSRSPRSSTTPGVAWDPRTSRSRPRWPRRSCSTGKACAPRRSNVWEVNEAFAAVAWSTANLLGIDPKGSTRLAARSRSGIRSARRARASRLRRASVARARRRARHRGDLLRRRPGRRDPDQGRLTWSGGRGARRTGVAPSVAPVRRATAPVRHAGTMVGMRGSRRSGARIRSDVWKSDW